MTLGYSAPDMENAESMRADILNLEKIHQDRLSNQPVAQRSWTYGNYSEDFLGSTARDTPTVRRTFQATICLSSMRYQRKLRAKTRTWLSFFGLKVVQFELAIQLRTNTWMSPNLQIGIKVINRRLRESPIFKACHAGDLERVKTLIESGEAGINDMCDENGSLLYVSITISMKAALSTA